MFLSFISLSLSLSLSLSFSLSLFSQKILQDYESLQDIIAILELPEEDKQKFAEVFTNNLGKFMPIAEAISGFQELFADKYNKLPEVAFYIFGNVDEGIAKTVWLRSKERCMLFQICTN